MFADRNARHGRFAGTLLACAAALLLWAPAAPAATNNIFTVAGIDSAGFSGDDGPASESELDSPGGVAAMPDGSYLVADTLNNRVRRVSPAGIITTVAGTGAPGFSGDNGPASAAELNEPQGVAALPDGGYLIADTQNERVRRVSPTGTISTVAGSGTEGFSGDNGPAIDADLALPVSVAPTADGGFLIADFLNARIRRVSPAGTITTAVGDGTPAELNGPLGVAALPNGGFLIADTFNHRVRQVSPAGAITTVAGTGTEGFSGDGGPATLAALDTPQGVAVTADGGFLIADTANSRVRFVDADLRFPQGPQGVQGPPGPQGRQGPRGPAGPAARAPLAVALANARLGGLVRRRVVVRYAATERATVLMRIVRGTRTVRRVRGRARAGANTIRFRLPRQAGRYRLRLEARTADGRAASARGMLIVRSPRRGTG